jgi:uncharacterized protein YfaS (alpha-2-macroglobulin family)
MKYLLSLLAILFIQPLFAQNMNEPYRREWQKADSLLNTGLPESAATVANDIYKKAQQKGEQVQMLKAELFLLSADFQRSEEAYKEAIEKAEAYSAKNGFPVKNIWESVTAQLYWSYYQQHRWEIMPRTNVSDETIISDFQQWDAKRFFDRISMLYESSLSRADELGKIDISKYDPILVKGMNTRHLRPTLLDLLAFRALSYFENDEKDLTKPAFAFTMNDERAFAPANDFIHYEFQTKDSSSLQWKALRLYQRLLSLHQNDSKKDAGIDADLHRLAYAYQYSIVSNKTVLYKNALENIENRSNENPLSGLASIKIAELLLQQTASSGSVRGSKPGPKTQQIDYRPAKEKLEKVIARFPQDEAGILAKSMLQEIHRKALNVAVEEIVLPGEPSRFLLNYRNINKVSVKLVAIKDKERYWKRRHYGYDDEKKDALYGIPALKQWVVTLPGTADLADHSTELKIDALQTGMYAVIVSLDESFSVNDNILSYAIFQVSNLSMITNQNNGTGYVLHRKTGKPVNAVQVDFYKEQYNNAKQNYEPVKMSTEHAAADGSFSLKSKNEASYVRLNSGNDAVYMSGSYYSYSYGNEYHRTEQTFFFTDRAIYRPGQTIYFKGILFEKSDKGRKNEVIAKRSTSVTLYDANGQKVESKNFTTNEFGSFTGTFNAPEGLLTGNMRIENENGSVYFSVEEYKRPKFYAEFDTLKKDFALNDEVQVSGKALAYAGNNVDGAKVSYRVVRSYYFPYPWLCYYYRYMPQTSEMEIANGTTTTNAKGNFKIDFKALPDESIDPKTLPVFSYTITADVTDINGETRSTTKVVRIGYTSLNIIASIPDKIFAERMENLNVMTQNLNGDFVAADVSVSISKLKQPETVLRKRLWEMPDQFVMDSVAFKKDFPNDVYKEEDNHQNWGIEKAVWEKNIRTTKDGVIKMNENALQQSGWYVVSISAKDKNGNAITEKQYTQLVRDDAKTIEPLALLNKKPAAEPGDAATVLLLSGFDNLHVLRIVQDMEGLKPTEQLDYMGRPLDWTRKITEQDRGGMMVSYVAVKDNRVYTEQAVVNVPWSNKDLNISWETHRDKLQPGAQETWTMVISGNKKEKIAAEMVATLYDASLDAFKMHQWNWYGLFPSLNSYVYWNTASGFGQSAGMTNYNLKEGTIEGYGKSYDYLAYLELSGQYNYRLRSMRMEGEADRMYKGIAVQSATLSAGNIVDDKVAEKKAPTVAFTPPAAPPSPEGKEDPRSSSDNTNIAVRKNLQETAFFLPQMQADAQGNIRLNFTLPEALTEWKMMAFSHTKDMSTGYLEGKIKTQKDLMVMPNLPRFLRQGDHVFISAKISNLSDKNLNGEAKIELRNALNHQPVELPFRLIQKEKSFTVAKGQSTAVTWELYVPESFYVPVVITMSAKAGDFTDGEENTLPVITNRMLVTETLPLWINGEGMKQFSFDKLLHSDTSKTLAQYALTLEYTGNPAWYAVQALPYMMEYPYECAEQTFNRYYATALAAHIIEKAPRIKSIFEQWKKEGDLSSFSSPLEKNQELKSALLEETPWVMDAQNETEQHKRIAQLFDAYKLSKELNTAMKKLLDKQHPDGAFGWFEGMHADRYITQYIVTGLTKLQKLGVSDRDGYRARIIEKALPYLDQEIKRDYDNLIRNKVKMAAPNIGYTQVQYLYMRSFLTENVSKENKVSYDYYTSQANKYWSQFNAYTKGMIALALNRKGNTQTPKVIIQSLRETSINKEEMGMYWVQRGYGYWWYEAPIETQSLLIECFSEVDKDVAAINKMKLWLLKNKQTNNWETTKATADACYALLLTGSDWLENTPKVAVQLGDKTIKGEEQMQAAGSGYFKVRYNGDEVKPEMGNITLTVAGENSKSPSWGAVYWQYFENLDKISSAKTPLEIKKQLFIERNTARGPELVPLTDKNILKVGDKVRARIEILVDRDMEYVHLKDMRASCFEPVNVISSYKYQNGLGYYESTKDVSTNFFFDQLRKGKYVFEYPMFVQQKGDFSNGIATIQCMYAPEFSSHSKGVRVVVE